MYRVIQAFCDLEDPVETKDGPIYHVYDVGNEYPRPGKTVSEDRIQELAGPHNRQKRPLIELVQEVSVTPVDTAPAEAAPVEKPAARKRAKKK